MLKINDARRRCERKTGPRLRLLTIPTDERPPVIGSLVSTKSDIVVRSVLW
jgi:hypothetical protein